jgi:hypothetical protein
MMILFCQDGLGTTTGKALKKRCVCLQDAAEARAACEPTQARHRNDRSGRTGDTSGRKKTIFLPPPAFQIEIIVLSYGNLAKELFFCTACRWLEICVRGFRCEKRHFLRCHLYRKTNILPRQARDKHRGSTQTRVAFCAGDVGWWNGVGYGFGKAIYPPFHTEIII